MFGRPAEKHSSRRITLQEVDNGWIVVIESDPTVQYGRAVTKIAPILEEALVLAACEIDPQSPLEGLWRTRHPVNL